MSNKLKSIAKKAKRKLKLFKHVFHQSDKDKNIVTGIRFGFAKDDINDYIIGVDFRKKAMMTNEEVKETIDFFENLVKRRTIINKEIEEMTQG